MVSHKSTNFPATGKFKKSSSRYCSRHHSNLIWILPHPRIPHTHPLDDTKLRWTDLRKNRMMIIIICLRCASLVQKFSTPHLSLLAQCRTLLVTNEAVEFALDALKPAPLAVGKLPVKALADFLPVLAEVDAVVPDEVHFLFFIFGARWTATACC